MELKVGQKLWYVRKHGNPSEIEIAKIGSKWAYCRRGDGPVGYRPIKINKETLVVDGNGYTSPGTCYLSLESYEQEHELMGKWRQFIVDVPYNMPSDMTLEKINQIRRIIWGDSNAILQNM